MGKRSMWLVAVVVLVAAAAWFLGGRDSRSMASSASVMAGPASAGSVAVMPSRDLTFFYVVDATDGNIYVIDVSGGSGEVRGIKLAGNFRSRKVF